MDVRRVAYFKETKQHPHHIEYTNELTCHLIAEDQILMHGFKRNKNARLPSGTARRILRLYKEASSTQLASP